VDDATVTPFPLTGPGQRLYTDAGHRAADDLAEGLRDRGLQGSVGFREPPPVESKPKPKPKPRGKRAKAQQMKVGVKEAPKPKTSRREISSTLLELLGITLLTVGFGIIYLPMGFIVLGVCTILLGLALS
jgi:hypothetical protein